MVKAKKTMEKKSSVTKQKKSTTKNKPENDLQANTLSSSCPLEQEVNEPNTFPPRKKNVLLKEKTCFIPEFCT